jgi:hypothetical protein
MNPHEQGVVSSVVRIPAFQAGGPGSIPGRRTIFCPGLLPTTQYTLTLPTVLKSQRLGD